MKKLIIINLSAIFLIFTIIEFALKLFSNITPQGVEKGIIKITDNFTFNYPNINGKKVFGENIFTDENGFRIEKKDNFKKSFNSKNIYFIGGSVTFGNGIPQSETFSGILNKKLKNLKVINASVIGSNLRNNLKIIEKKIEKENSEMIFVNFSLDDLDDLNQIIDQQDNINNNVEISATQNLKNNIIIKKINNFVRSKSLTYVWLKNFLLNSNKNYYLYALNSFEKESNLISLENTLDLFSEQNLLFKDKIIFLIIPYNYQINDENCVKKDQAEKIIESSLLKKKINFIKFKDIFCNDKNKKKIFLKYDPSHLSKYGHKIVAKNLMDMF